MLQRYHLWKEAREVRAASERIIESLRLSRHPSFPTVVAWLPRMQLSPDLWAKVLCTWGFEKQESKSCDYEYGGETFHIEITKCAKS